MILLCPTITLAIFFPLLKNISLNYQTKKNLLLIKRITNIFGFEKYFHFGDLLQGHESQMSKN